MRDELRADSWPVRRGSAWRAVGAWAAIAAGLAAFHGWTYGDCTAGFFHFDDFWALAAAAHIRLRSPLDLVAFLKPIHGFVLYRPISILAYFYALREAFGYDPVSYHAAQIVFHILNGMLVYAIADAVLFSRPLAAAAALLYATAPGHAIAACWVVLFTMTGTAFFYFLAVWAWVRLASRWRVPLTLGLFATALLASEHAVSLPLTLTAGSLLLMGPPRRREVWALAFMYLISGAYVAAKLYYMRHWVASAFPSAAAQAYIESGYHVSLDPFSMLRHLGRYCAFTLDLLYGHVSSDTRAFVLGGLTLTITAAATVCVVTGRWTARQLRAAAFGLVVFISGLSPVVVLPAHLYSYYVGIAAMGMAVAIVGFTSALPRWGRQAPWAVVGLLLAVHVASTAREVRQSEEFRFLRSFSTAAARWLYTLRLRADQPGIAEVVVPSTGVTEMVFDAGEAHRLLLCAGYRVRTTRTPEALESNPTRLVLRQPDPLPAAADARNPWFWLRPCSPGRNFPDAPAFQKGAQR